jgi:hypothetical protein
MAARRVRNDWALLCAATPDPAFFDRSTVVGLPESARRYLKHVIAAATQLWQSVQVSMVGRIKLRGWRPFTATQVVAPSRGYIWAADARLFGVPVIGYDRLRAGTAEMRWPLQSDLLKAFREERPESRTSPTAPVSRVRLPNHTTARGREQSHDGASFDGLVEFGAPKPQV